MTPTSARGEQSGVNPAVANLAAALLRQAADEFANHGCNDLALPVTAGNRLLCAQMNCWAGGSTEDAPARLSVNRRVFVLPDWLAMRFCAHVLSPEEEPR